MQYHTFSEGEVEELLRASEGAPSTHAGNRPGHARERHLLLSNAELLARHEMMVAAEQARRARRRAEAADRGRRWLPGGPIYLMVTAFSTWSDMVEMGCQLLKSPQAQAGLSAMFVGPMAAEGARLEICFIAPRDVTMRYVQGGAVVRTMPVRQLTMLVDRSDRGRLRLHVQTFFGGVPVNEPHSGAVLSNPRGEEILGFTGFP